MIENRFQNVEITPIKDTGTTGNFEITVGSNLVWSKKTRSEGFFSQASESKQEAVFQAITNAGGITEQKTDHFVIPGGSLNSGAVKNGDYTLMGDGEGDKEPASKCKTFCSLMTTFAAIPAIVGA